MKELIPLLEKRSDLAILKKARALQPCIEDLRRFVSGPRKEFREVLFSNNPIETANQRPIKDQGVKNERSVEVWLTAEQLESATADLAKIISVIENGEADHDVVFKKLNNRIDAIYELVTCRAVNTMYFDQWRATHNSYGCGNVVATTMILGTAMAVGLKSENAILSTVGWTLSALISLSLFMKASCDPNVHSDRVRKKMHRLFTEKNHSNGAKVNG